jgi:hypothetical protein
MRKTAYSLCEDLWLQVGFKVGGPYVDGFQSSVKTQDCVL